MTKSKNIKIDENDDITFVQEISPYPEGESLETFNGKPPNHVIEHILQHLQHQIDAFNERHHVVKNEIVEDLQVLVSHALKQIRESNIQLSLAVFMYDIGQLIGKINVVSEIKFSAEQLKNLRKGRAQGRDKSKIKALERRETLRAFAVDFFCKNPTKTNANAISAMRSSPSTNIQQLAAKYKRLDEVIAGCKITALEQLEKNT